MGSTSSAGMLTLGHGCPTSTCVPSGQVNLFDSFTTVKSIPPRPCWYPASVAVTLTWYTAGLCGIVAGAWKTTPEAIVDADPLAGVRVGPDGETVRATCAPEARRPSWSRTSTPNVRGSLVGTRSPAFSFGVTDRNDVPVAKTVTTTVLVSIGYPAAWAVTWIVTSGFAGTDAGALYVTVSVPPAPVVPVHVFVPGQGPGPPVKTPFPEVTDRATVAPDTAVPSWFRTVTVTAAVPPSTIAEGYDGTAWMNTFEGLWML